MGLIILSCRCREGRKIWVCVIVIKGFVEMKVVDDGGDFEGKGWRKLVPIAF